VGKQSRPRWRFRDRKAPAARTARAVVRPGRVPAALGQPQAQAGRGLPAQPGRAEEPLERQAA